MEVLRGKVGETKSTLSVVRDWKGMTFLLCCRKNCNAGFAIALSTLIIKSLDSQQYRSLRSNYFVHALEEGRRLVSLFERNNFEL